jgi:hypothetical protein
MSIAWSAGCASGGGAAIGGTWGAGGGGSTGLARGCRSAGRYAARLSESCSECSNRVRAPTSLGRTSLGRSTARLILIGIYRWTCCRRLPNPAQRAPQPRCPLRAPCSTQTFILLLWNGSRIQAEDETRVTRRRKPADLSFVVVSGEFRRRWAGRSNEAKAGHRRAASDGRERVGRRVPDRTPPPAVVFSVGQGPGGHGGLRAGGPAPARRA